MTKPADPIFNDFLHTQFKQAVQLARESDLLKLIPMVGNPPFQYVVEYSCRGLLKDDSGAIVESDGPWGFGVNFPANYLRGGFHPAEVLAYLGPHPRPWHVNLKPPFVCLEIRPAMPLTEIIYTLYDFITWQLYSSHDEGLNHDAAQWSRHNKARLPVDRRPLKRRVLNLNVKPVEPQNPEDPKP